MTGGLDPAMIGDIITKISADPSLSAMLGASGKNPPAVTPEMMAALPGIIAALRPSFEAANAGGAENTASAEHSVGDSARDSDASGGTAPSAADAMRVISGARSGGNRDRDKLLEALKPYLSDTRREALDGILSVIGLSELFLPNAGKSREG